MATPILMPKQGNTVEECLLTGWRKRKGDSVAVGDVVADIETDKAAFEVESTAAGQMLETFFEEGELVPVQVNICAVGEPGEDVESLRPGGSAAPAAGATEPASAAAEPEAAPSAESAAGAVIPVAVAADAPAAPMSPRAKRFLARHPFVLGPIQGSGAGGRIIEKDVAAAYAEASRLSPVAADMHAAGLSAPARGTGVGGMIRGQDMGGAAPEVAAAATAGTPAEPVPAGAAVEVRPLSNIRRLIASRMHESLESSAQYTLNTEVDATALLELRKRIKAKREALGLGDVNINDMILFATIRALERHPEVNAEFIDGELRLHRAIHLAFACDTPRGLMVPVIRNSQDLRIRALAERVRELAAQANEGRVSPDDLSGGTFTVSNLGPLGITSFTPIINAPQVAILGVCATELKPVRRNGEVVFVDHIHLSLTCNHQVVDGAPGARFLRTLREIIENFELLVLSD